MVDGTGHSPSMQVHQHMTQTGLVVQLWPELADGSISIDTNLLGDEHPFTSYFDVQKGYSVLTHPQIYWDNLSPVLSNLPRLPGNVHCVLGHQNHLHICCPVLGFTGVGARQCCPYCLVPLMWLVGSLKEWKIAWWFEYAWIFLDLFVSTCMDLIPLGAAGLLILSIPRSFWRKFNTHSRKFTKDCGKACFRTQIAAWGQRRQGWRRWLGTVARVPAHRCYYSSFMVSYWMIRWNQLRKRWTHQDERDNLDKKVRRKVGHYGDLWSRSCGIHHDLMYMQRLQRPVTSFSVKPIWMMSGFISCFSIASFCPWQLTPGWSEGLWHFGFPSRQNEFVFPVLSTDILSAV